MTEQSFYLFLGFVAGVILIAAVLIYLDRRERVLPGDHRHTPAE